VDGVGLLHLENAPVNDIRKWYTADVNNALVLCESEGESTPSEAARNPKKSGLKGRVKMAPLRTVRSFHQDQHPESSDWLTPRKEN
jgi:hypothetical protein